METFWNTIAQYNESTWWAQILITAAGILLTALLYRRPTVWTKRSMKIYMVFLNGWIALVYYAMYCDTRNYHYVLSAFWGTVALIWLWDLFTGYTPFERNPKYPMLAGVLYAMPFLYPLLSWRAAWSPDDDDHSNALLGSRIYHRDCCWAFSRKVNLLVILFLCHWALIAFSKVYVYKIPEDLLLASATVPAIYLSSRIT